MIHIVLYQPEIPPNTGNVLRLIHNSGSELHLIEPLGFELDDKRVSRAGLDYIDWQRVSRYPGWQQYLEATGEATRYAISTRGTLPYAGAAFRAGDHLVFGPETRGLPQDLLNWFPADHRLRIPMAPNSRSLNLSNAVALTLFEAWRQLDFEGGL